jgi:hypothetical protein
LTKTGAEPPGQAIAAATLPWRSGTIQPRPPPVPVARRSPIASIVLYVVPAVFVIEVIELLTPR